MTELKEIESNDNTNISVLLKNNKEYTKNLINLIQPEIYNTFKTIYNDIKKSSKTQSGILIPFQNSVAEIPKWTDEILTEKVETLKKSLDCEWLDNLIEAVFSTICN